MPADTETRIVEMRFSNKDFERNIAKSQKSLEDFKKELNFKETSKGLRDFTSSMNGIDFHGLTSNIQKLTDKFTGLGNATEWVLSRIRYGMENAMLKTEQFIKSFTTAQIAVGQSKYDALNKSVQSLIATGKYTEEEAYEVFERVTHYTDQTSANFQTMVDQISTFVATGKGLRISESAMEGISNMTMKAGKSATEASIAMGIFSKAMGANYLSYQNWLSLNQSAHIITEDFRNQILEAAVSTGDLIKKQNKYYTNSKKYGKALKVTAQTLETTLKKKWLSSNTMMAVFDKYYLEELDPDAYDKAMDVMSKAAEKGVFTLEDFNAVGQKSADMANGLRKRLIRAAVATGDLTEKNGKYYTNAKKYGKEVEVTAENIEKTFNIGWAGKDTIGAVLTDYEFANVAYKSAQRAMTFADAMNAIKESVSTGWMESFRLVFGDVTEAMEFFTNLCERVIDGIAGIGEARNDILKIWSSGGGRQNLIDIVLGDYGKDVETGAYGLLDLFDDVGKVISQGFWDMVKIFAGTEEFTLGNWDKPGFKEAFLGRKLRDFTQSIKDFLASIRDFFTAETKVGDKSKTRLEMIHETVQGIAGALVLAWKLIEGVIYFVTEVGRQLQPSADAIQYFFSQLGLTIYETADQANKGESIRSFFDSLLEVLRPLTGTINAVVGKLTDLLLTFIEWGQQTGAFKRIGKAFETAFTKIGKVINRIGIPILTFFGDLFDIGSSLFEHNFDAQSIAEAGQDIKKALDKMFSSILGVESMDKVGQELQKRFKGVLDDLVKNAPPWVKNVVNAIKDLFGLWDNPEDGNSQSIFTKIRKFFEGGFGSIRDALKRLFGSFKEFNFATFLKTKFGLQGAYSFLSEVAGWFKGTNLYGVLMMFLGATTLFSLFRLIRNISGIVEKIGEIGDSLKSGFKVRYDDYGEYLMKMAEGIAILVACIAILGSMKTGNLIQGIVSLGIIMGMIIAFNKLLKRDFDKGNIGDQLGFAAQITAIGFAITAITLAMSILMLAMLPLSKDPGKMATAVAGFALIMAAIGGFIHFMLKDLVAITKSVSKDWKLGAADFLKIGGIMIALSVSIAILAVGLSVLMMALVPLANTGWSGMIRAVLAVVVILAALGIFIKLMLKETLRLAVVLGGGKKVAVDKLANLLLKLGAAFALLAISISILVIALMPLALMSWEAFARAMLGLGIIILELAGMIKLIQKLGTGDKSISVKIAGLAGFAASLGILVLALAPLAMMSWEAWLRALIGLGIIMLEMAGMIKLLQKLGTKDKSISVKIAGLAGFAAGLGILVLALVPLAMLKWEAWLRGLIGLGIVMLELAGMIKLLQRLGSNDRTLTVKIAGLTGLAIGIAILALAMLPIASLSWEGLAKGLVGLLGIMTLLVLFVTSLTYINVSATKMASFILLAGGLWLAVQAILPMTNLSWEQIGKAAVSLVTVLGLLFLFLFGMNFAGLKGAITGLAGMVGLAIVMLALSLTLNEIKNINPNVMQTFMTGMTTMIIAMAAVIGVLSIIPLGAGIKAIALLAIAVAAITAILSWAIPTLMGAIGSGLTDFSAKLSMMASLIQEFSDKMKATDENGITKAEGIFGRLKNLIVSLIGIGNYSAAINAFTTALFNLSTGLEIFANHTRDLPDPETGFAFKMIDKFLSYSDVLAGFAIGDFAKQIYMLGVGLYAFDYLGRDMADPNDSAPLQLLTKLAACAGDIQTLSTIGLDGLKGQLAGLGGAMMLYAQGAKEVTGVEGDQTSNIQGALGILQAITTAFVENGGFTIPDMPTEDELGGFGADLAALAGALIKFSEASKGLGEGTDKAIELLGFLSDLKTKLTAENLTAVKIFKEEGITPYGLAEFSLDIFALSNALKNFVDNTKDIDEGKLKNATDALGAFSSLRGTLIGQDSVVGLLNFFTDNSITNDQLVQFGKDIEQLGLALKSFATSVTWGEEQEGSFQKALDALGFLAELKTKLPEIGGLKEIIAGRKQTLTDLGTEIEALGVAIADFNGKITDENGNEKLNLTAMSHALDIINQFVTLLTRLQTEMGPVGGVLQAFTGKNYDTSNLQTDLENFKSVIGELVGVSDLLNNNDPEAESKIPSQEQLTSAIGAIDTITTFVKDLGEKMPKVGGQLNGIKGWFKGENYDLEALKGDLGQFKSVISELNSLAVDLNGGADGKGAVLTEATATETIGVIDRITDFMITLATKMGRIGGIENAWNDFWSGGKYDFEKLGTQIGKLGEGLGKFSAGVGKDFNAESALQAISIAEGISNVMANLNTLVDNTGYYDLDRYVEGMLNFIKVMNEGYSNPYSGFETGPMIDGIAQLASGVSKAIDEAGGIDPQNIDIFQKMVQALQQLSMTNPDFNFGTVGENIANSVAVGITGHESVVTEAAINMALSAVEAISKLLDEELDLNPTITPVLDLTNLNNGIIRANGIINGSSMTLDTSNATSLANSSIPNTASPIVIQNSTDLSGVYMRMEAMAIQVNELSKYIERVKVVLDTGAIAGAVTEQVDINLGTRQFYEERGN